MAVLLPSSEKAADHGVMLQAEGMEMKVSAQRLDTDRTRTHGFVLMCLPDDWLAFSRLSCAILEASVTLPMRLALTVLGRLWVAWIQAWVLSSFLQ
jgi:hypothetical protein